MKFFNIGDKVKGKYFGREFTGVINEESRPHPLRHTAYIWFVDLDTPMEYSPGDPQSSVCLILEIIEGQWSNEDDCTLEALQ